MKNALILISILSSSIVAGPKAFTMAPRGNSENTLSGVLQAAQEAQEADIRATEGAYAEARQLYLQAAEAYRTAGFATLAARAYYRASDMSLAMQNEDDSENELMMATDMFARGINGEISGLPPVSQNPLAGQVVETDHNAHEAYVQALAESLATQSPHEMRGDFRSALEMFVLEGDVAAATNFGESLADYFIGERNFGSAREIYQELANIEALTIAEKVEYLRKSNEMLIRALGG